jgi:hypothetical protein
MTAMSSGVRRANQQPGQKASGAMAQDPFEDMTHADFVEALQPENWKEVSQRLHTPTLDALLQEGRLFLLFPDSQRRQFERSDVEALTRFLDQYANVQPLPALDETVFQNWQPARVESEGEDTK